MVFTRFQVPNNCILWSTEGSSDTSFLWSPVLHKKWNCYTDDIKMSFSVEAYTEWNKNSLLQLCLKDSSALIHFTQNTNFLFPPSLTTEWSLLYALTWKSYLRFGNSKTRPESECTVWIQHIIKRVSLIRVQVIPDKTSSILSKIHFQQQNKRKTKVLYFS